MAQQPSLASGMIEGDATRALQSEANQTPSSSQQQSSSSSSSRSIRVGSWPVASSTSSGIPAAAAHHSSIATAAAVTECTTPTSSSSNSSSSNTGTFSFSPIHSPLVLPIHPPPLASAALGGINTRTARQVRTLSMRARNAMMALRKDSNGNSGMEKDSQQETITEGASTRSVESLSSINSHHLFTPTHHEQHSSIGHLTPTPTHDLTNIDEKVKDGGGNGYEDDVTLTLPPVLTEQERQKAEITADLYNSLRNPCHQLLALVELLDNSPVLHGLLEEKDMLRTIRQAAGSIKNIVVEGSNAAAIVSSLAAAAAGTATGTSADGNKSTLETSTTGLNSSRGGRSSCNSRSNSVSNLDHLFHPSTFSSSIPPSTSSSSMSLVSLYSNSSSSTTSASVSVSNSSFSSPIISQHCTPLNVGVSKLIMNASTAQQQLSASSPFRIHSSLASTESNTNNMNPPMSAPPPSLRTLQRNVSLPIGSGANTSTSANASSSLVTSPVTSSTSIVVPNLNPLPPAVLTSSTTGTTVVATAPTNFSTAQQDAVLRISRTPPLPVSLRTISGTSLNAPKFDVSGLNILIVDDMSLNRKVLRKMLDGIPNVDAACDGLDAVNMVRAKIEAGMHITLPPIVNLEQMMKENMSVLEQQQHQQQQQQQMQQQASESPQPTPTSSLPPSSSFGAGSTCGTPLISSTNAAGVGSTVPTTGLHTPPPASAAATTPTTPLTLLASPEAPHHHSHHHHSSQNTSGTGLSGNINAQYTAMLMHSGALQHTPQPSAGNSKSFDLPSAEDRVERHHSFPTPQMRPVVPSQQQQQQVQQQPQQHCWSSAVPFAAGTNVAASAITEVTPTSSVSHASVGIAPFHPAPLPHLTSPMSPVVMSPCTPLVLPTTPPVVFSPNSARRHSLPQNRMPSSAATVSAASSLGGRASSHAPTLQYDVIITDLSMPKLNGLQEVQLIRQLENELNLPNIPIIAVTSNTLVNDRLLCAKNEFTYFLAKPFQRKDILSILELIVHERSLSQHSLTPWKRYLTQQEMQQQQQQQQQQMQVEQALQQQNQQGSVSTSTPIHMAYTPQLQPIVTVEQSPVSGTPSTPSALLTPPYAPYVSSLPNPTQSPNTINEMLAFGMLPAAALGSPPSANGMERQISITTASGVNELMRNHGTSERDESTESTASESSSNGSGGLSSLNSPSSSVSPEYELTSLFSPSRCGFPFILPSVIPQPSLGLSSPVFSSPTHRRTVAAVDGSLITAGTSGPSPRLGGVTNLTAAPLTLHSRERSSVEFMPATPAHTQTSYHFLHQQQHHQPQSSISGPVTEEETTSENSDLDGASGSRITTSNSGAVSWPNV